MSIVEAFAQIVNYLDPLLSFNYADKAQNNHEADEINYQVGLVHLIEIEKGKFNINPVTGSMKDSKVIFLRFVKLTDFDELAIERDPVIQEMEQLAKMFIVKYNATGLFNNLTGDIPYIYVFNEHDVNVSGIELQFTCTPLIPLSVCLT